MFWLRHISVDPIEAAEVGDFAHQCVIRITPLCD